MTWDKSIRTEVLRRLSEGESLRAICRDKEMPGLTTVMQWLDADSDFAAQYARAREIGAEAMAEEILEIADDGRNDWMERNAEDNAGWVQNGEAMQRSRLRVDARKWLMSKMAPKKYGDKVDVGGSLGVTVNWPVMAPEVER